MRQTVSNACWDHEDCDNCGLSAPDGPPCACDCHQAPAEAPAQHNSEWGWLPPRRRPVTGKDEAEELAQLTAAEVAGELAPGVAQFGKMYDAAPVGDTVGYCFRCRQPFTGEHCPRCDSSTPAEELDAEEQLERRRLDFADNAALSNMDPADRTYLEDWPRSRGDYDDYADDLPSEKQLIDWREANEYTNEGEEPDYPEEDTTNEQE